MNLSSRPARSVGESGLPKQPGPPAACCSERADDFPAAAFPPVERHGAIGDRRTGALVAADGTIDWFCAADFDGPPLFGALLDPAVGGFCTFGPRHGGFGRQRYLTGTTLLRTAWTGASGKEALELVDTMAWPADRRTAGQRRRRVILRRLRATQRIEARFELCPRWNFGPPHRVRAAAGGAVFAVGDGTLRFWASFETRIEAQAASALLVLEPGAEHWVALGWNGLPSPWSATRARRTFAAAQSYWLRWSDGLKLGRPSGRDPALRRAALTVQLLSHAGHDCAVAALTSSLPEREGGDRNYDYRFAWVRDASLSLALLARMGKIGEVEHYLKWLCSVGSSTAAPLQVCYRLDGGCALPEEEIGGVFGYAGSRPVRRGNRAAKQRQPGSLGFFADCTRIYFDEGGRWRDPFWRLLRRVATFAAAHWREPDSGIWELPEEADFVASRVMSWVTLERSAHIAERTGHAAEARRWREVAAEIHAEVMDRGWCERKNSFRQRYGSDALDAAALLIPLMEFLPPDHPRVAGTVDALERELTVDGLLHRFDPSVTPGCHGPSATGAFEGAFLPCVFWHAHALARMGRREQAGAILARCEAIAGELGLFAEEADAREGTFRGNTPLLFSHVEYARAIGALNQGRASPAGRKHP